MVGLGLAFRRPAVGRPGMGALTGGLGVCPQSATDKTLPGWVGLVGLEGRWFVGCRERVGCRLDDRFRFHLVGVACGGGPHIMPGLGLL